MNIWLRPKRQIAPTEAPDTSDGAISITKRAEDLIREGGTIAYRLDRYSKPFRYVLSIDLEDGNSRIIPSTCHIEILEYMKRVISKPFALSEEELNAPKELTIEVSKPEEDYSSLGL